MYYYWDNTYLLLLPALLLTIIAQIRVKTVTKRYAQMPTRRGEAAQSVAAGVLSAGGATDVAVERIAGNLTDHYDPRSHTLRLSDGVYNDSSVAAVAIAAHEAGHALQQAEGYAPLRLRSVAVPVCNWGSRLAMPLFLVGLLIPAIQPIAYVGVAMYGLVVLFSLITLPVEFNASRRAMAALTEGGYVDHDEEQGARAVLNAAALTYVAAAAVALMQLLRLLAILGRSRSRD